ncbi:ribonuclease III [Fulvivirgaceae bacterium BMA10]|uniref:Ribonuclease 3 n=1 Tax=Splendidivirga corallicola TaxID=3051826 RepID=A0ABT8KRH0_9BACT|nr:ribonuclease III [Fulvivirgaceae bacterium BMA10]
MNLFFKRLSWLLTVRSENDKKLAAAIKMIVGRHPFNLDLYKLAVKHSSVAEIGRTGFKESNERLEYLGDAILGAIIAEYLFKKFPYKEEGFLTEIRSRIVNRESLNNVSRKIGLNDLVQYDANRKNSLSHKSIHGDTLEALLGAIYLDRGFKFCKRFIIKKLLLHYDIKEIINNNPNSKSLIIEWAQKENKDIRFEVVEVKNKKHFKEFVVQLFIENEPIGKGFGLSKKKAEQDAAQKSCDLLNLT